MSDAGPTGAPPGGPPVGSLAEEAAKLAEALQDFTRNRGSGWARTADAHLATGSAECRLCPVCRLIALARDTGPEVADHLADATASLLQAVRVVAEGYRDREASPEGRTAGEGPDREHITLIDEEDLPWD